MLKLVWPLLAACSLQAGDFTRFVDPMIGTAGTGHAFPGACYPMGMIQASPDTGNITWEYCAGYYYRDEKINGFSQTHLNGAGAVELGDLLLMPFTGTPDRESYASPYRKENQTSVPGFYQVKLDESDIDVQLTASKRTAFHRYTFNNIEKPPRVLLDLQYGLISYWRGKPENRVVSYEKQLEDPYTFTGHLSVKGYVTTTREIYFVVKFDKPVTAHQYRTVLKKGKAPQCVFDFDIAKGGALQIKVALSTVSVEQAKKNMEAEIPAWDFDGTRAAAVRAWNEVLGRIEIEGTEEQCKSFYTAMYHLFIQPCDFSDADGTFRGMDEKIGSVGAGHGYYGTFSLWDTFRAAHPLYTIIAPDKVEDFINTMLLQYKGQGFLPVLTITDRDTVGMIGNHSIPVIADAYFKGFKFDSEAAFETIKTTLTNPHKKSDWAVYDEYGYLPFDKIPHESVSRTLEYGYDDACAARLAKALGKTADAEFFFKRSQRYRNLFDPSVMLMRAKNSKGEWREPFSPFTIGHNKKYGMDFTEGNAWQYSWHVLQDVDGLIALMGGKDAAYRQLSNLFTLPSNPEVEGMKASLDVSGLIGQYAHGNEPSHHVVYLFNYMGQGWRTQELVREICSTQYKNTPDGLCGNDDCGQMSAWYIFSSLGFYPVNPCGDGYVFGAPQIPKAVIHLPGGKTFTVRAEGLSERNRYVKRTLLNGKEIEGFRLAHGDVVAGGELVFEMTDKAVKK